MARGGRRSGSPGTAYQNRTDLQTARPLAPTAAPGQPYGAEAAQLRAQQAVPMAPPPPPVASGGAPPAPAAPTLAGPAPQPVPGAAGDFHRPTERPTEPITAGLGGPPGILPGGPDPVIAGAAVLNSLKEVTPQMASLRNVVNATLANRAAP